MENYREVLIRFETHLVSEMGSTPDALLASVWGLSIHLLRHLGTEPRLSAQIFSTGYLGNSKGERYDGLCQNVATWLIHWWRRVRGEQIDQPAAFALVQEAFTALTYTPKDLADISLWDRIPFRLILDVGDRVIFDLAAITAVMSDLFRTVGFDVPSAEGVKGGAFEGEVARQGRGAGFSVWQQSRVLRLDDERKRDVDVAFIVDDTMLVVECKAFSQNKRIDRGDCAALQNRWETLRDEYLDQARTLKEFLEQNRCGANYEIPAEVVRFEYCLCTPGVEWIPSRDPELWITETIPRICTPAEVVELLTTMRDTASGS